MLDPFFATLKVCVMLSLLGVIVVKVRNKKKAPLLVETFAKALLTRPRSVNDRFWTGQFQGKNVYLSVGSDAADDLIATVCIEAPVKQGLEIRTKKAKSDGNLSRVDADGCVFFVSNEEAFRVQFQGKERVIALIDELLGRVRRVNLERVLPQVPRLMEGIVVTTSIESPFEMEEYKLRHIIRILAELASHLERMSISQ